MNKMHTAAVIALVTSGLYLAWNCVNILLSLLLTAATQFYAPILAYQLLQGGILAAFAWILIFKRNSLASKIVPAQELAAPPTQAMWVPFGFRLAALVAGLLIFPNAIFNLGQTIYAYIISRTETGALLTQYTDQTASIDQLLYPVVTLAISAYLIAGAPHLVKWHAKKTLQQSAQPVQPPESI
jgi:hypothetical protein